MTSAQAMEEQLQQSVLLSQQADDSYDASNTNATSRRAMKSIQTGNAAHTSGATRDNEDRDASADDLEEDAEGEEELDLIQQPQDLEDAQENGNADDLEEEEVDDDEEEEEEEDAEGEEDDVDEVGTVKFKPADSDEDDDQSDEVSDAPSVVDDESEEEAPWQDARDAAEDDDEDSEVAAANVCMFCKQDEEHDPSEDFEMFLTCQNCGNNAHQQCARDEAAMSERNSSRRWKCPQCVDSETEGDQESAATDALASQGSDIPKMARDLLAAKTGSEDGDTHSIFNDLVVDGDSLNASRLLRKRKTSSVDPEDTIVAARMRRRDTSTDLQNDEGTDGANSNDAAGSRSVRAMRLKVSRPPPVTVEKHTRTSMIVKFQVRPGNLKEILSRKRRERKRTGGGSSRPPRVAPPASAGVSDAPIPMIETPFTADSYSQPFYSFFDRDTDEAKGKPYGGILSEAEADTSKTLPAAEDRRRFDQAKRKADDEWRARVLAMQAEADVPVRRPKKSSDHASQIECIEFGGWEIDTWYAAPYPAEYSRNRVLYICEFCLKYMNSDYVAWRHKLKCAAKHPPGDEIYRHGSISFFEVDGRKNPVYCQNLCLLAKLFLGSKTLYYDVEPFLFYVLCEYDECGYHFVGYFSKEKRPSSQNNVSCILTLPIHQRKGYGNLLIDFSYLLTKVEEKTGSPEKPLSDLGLVSYRSYWRLVLCRYLLELMEKGDFKTEGLSIKKISDDTAMTPDDVVAGLEGLRAIVRDPHTKLYAFRVDLDFCRQYVANWESKGHVKLKPEALAWTPYVMSRSNAANLEMAPISTVAPREEDEAKVDEGLKLPGTGAKVVINGVKKLPENDAEDAVMDVEGTPDDQLKQEEEAPAGVTVGEDKENSTPQDTSPDQMDVDEEEDQPWDAPYKDIPAVRFEIFPQIPGGRRADRPRPGPGRPPLNRSGSSASRPRPRPSGGSARRASSGRPKSSGSRRKTGGTGRGPGRWPKGTKKADYGNATSGPGFPPGWSEKQEDGTPSNMDGELPAQEEVRVLVSPSVGTNGAARALLNGQESAHAPGAHTGEEVAPAEEDVDAEGEDV